MHVEPLQCGLRGVIPPPCLSAVLLQMARFTPVSSHGLLLPSSPFQGVSQDERWFTKIKPALRWCRSSRDRTGFIPLCPNSPLLTGFVVMSLISLMDRVSKSGVDTPTVAHALHPMERRISWQSSFLEHGDSVQ
jgi:hypothetical protein